MKETKKRDKIVRKMFIKGFVVENQYIRQECRKESENTRNGKVRREGGKNVFLKLNHAIMEAGEMSLWTKFTATFFFSGKRLHVDSST